MTESTSPLFTSWLTETRGLQTGSYGLDYSRFEDPAALVAYIKDMHIATIAELQEMLDETSWKPWQADEPYVHRELVIKEAIDALHFIANILTAVGATDADLSRAYAAKMQVNRDRQARKGGYRVKGETADKCVLCSRALDDVGPSSVDKRICSICAGEKSYA